MEYLDYTVPVTSSHLWVLEFKAAVAVDPCHRGNVFTGDKSNYLIWELLPHREGKTDIWNADQRVIIQHQHSVGIDLSKRLQAVAHAVDALLFEHHGDGMGPQGVPELLGGPLPNVVPHDDDPPQVWHRLVMVEQFQQDVGAVIRLYDYGKCGGVLLFRLAPGNGVGIAAGDGSMAKGSHGPDMAPVLDGREEGSQSSTNQEKE